MENKFSVGTTVMLKSGGPIMTVESVDNNCSVCIWFYNCMKYKEKFISLTLEEVVTNNSCAKN